MEQHSQPSAPTVVHVVAKRGGFGRAVTFVIGLFLFFAVFTSGIVLGVVVMVSGGTIDEMVLRQTYRRGTSSSSIAIIPVVGTIDRASAQFVRAAVDHVLNDSAIRGVVLRVDSPGGGVSPSDQIWAEVGRIKDAGLPVVASFGGVAASGGYYVSCAADSIVAEQTCVTGSIGVIAQLFTVEDLMTKIGVEPVTLVASGSPDKDVANDIFRSWDERDREQVTTMLDSAYDVFRRRVADGRGHVISSSDEIDRLADGSVFTADEALASGLVDAIGYLDDAIAQLEQRARLKAGRARVFRIVQPPRLFGNGVLFRRNTSRDLDADAIRRVVGDLASPRVMYLMQ